MICFIGYNYNKLLLILAIILLLIIFLSNIDDKIDSGIKIERAQSFNDLAHPLFIRFNLHKRY